MGSRAIARRMAEQRRRVFAAATGAVFVLGLAGSAQADEPSDPRNRASFQVVVTREVANDWATARLAAVAEGQDPARVAAEVNARIEQALGRIGREKGVEVESGAYSTHPIYDANRIVRWQARQEVRLESADMGRLAKLIGSLQEQQLLLSGIGFSVKRETREALESELTLEALRKFRARADLVTKGMGSAGWSLVALTVGQGGAQPPFYAMRAESDMAMKSAAAPSFEAGKSDLSVTVDGTIELD